MSATSPFGARVQKLFCTAETTTGLVTNITSGIEVFFKTFTFKLGLTKDVNKFVIAALLFPSFFERVLVESLPKVIFVDTATYFVDFIY